MQRTRRRGTEGVVSALACRVSCTDTRTDCMGRVWNAFVRYATRGFKYVFSTLHGPGKREFQSSGWSPYRVNARCTTAALRSKYDCRMSAALSDSLIAGFFCIKQVSLECWLCILRAPVDVVADEHASVVAAACMS